MGLLLQYAYRFRPPMVSGSRYSKPSALRKQPTCGSQ